MKNGLYRSLPALAATAFLLVMLAMLPALVPHPRPIPVVSKAPVKDAPPTVGSFANLKKLLRGMDRMGGGQHTLFDNFGGRRGVAMMEESAGVRLQKSVKASSADRVAFSPTNIQVQGVDEADIVKTDGEYIYTLRESELIVTKAHPADELKVMSRLNFGNGKFYATELYVDNEKLIVIGGSNIEIPIAGGTEPGSEGSTGARNAEPEVQNMKSPLIDGVRPEDAPGPNVEMRGTVKVIIFDTSDKSKLKKIKEAEMEGDYLSSRKIGPTLYIVSNKYVDMYRILNESKDTGGARPLYRDTAAGDGVRRLPYSKIWYLREPSEPSYLMVAGLNLDDPEEQIKVHSYLGAGQNIYSSTKNLYVAAVKNRGGRTGGIGIMEDRMVADERQATGIYKFALNNGSVEFAAEGEASGTILNQFSMDEHQGSFRIATTEGYVGGEGETAAKNNLYIFDPGLKMTGKLENVAAGERIYSVRFMGDRAYMVTFKNVDPLFVIDLKNPSAPAILGELKIPGYSDYLHPYDENHIIGFGKEAVDAGSVEGPPASSFAYYQGMKIALFDVTNVKKPVEKFKTVIGDRGTDSELLHNHKALLFDKEKNLLAFPVTVMEIQGGQKFEPSMDDGSQYGTQIFEGAYVYDVSLRDGLNLKGKITHSRGAQSPYEYDGRYRIKRVLYIDKTLYSVSEDFIKANDLKTLDESGQLSLR